MIKSELTNGTKIFVLNVQQFVSLGVFAVVLRNEFYNEISEKLESILQDYVHLMVENTNLYDENLSKLLSESYFIKKMTKKKAEELLRFNLKMYGKEGSIEDEMYSSSYERGEALNRCYDLALEWIKEKYPYLSN